jgi:cell fate (sporulation/competence/biofilm development) regulator YlbF (YheA/YmcA/DUF963 family)
MQTTTQESDILTKKIEELCQTLLQQPEVQSIRKRLDAFAADTASQQQYERLSERGEYLHHKQHQGAQLTQEEINEFEKSRDEFFQNPIAKGFVDAQEQMHKLQENVSRYVSKTLEFGRVPNAEEIQAGSCGHGCGCHH